MVRYNNQYNNSNTRDSGHSNSRFGGRNNPQQGDQRPKRNDPPRRKRNPLKGIEYVDYTNTKLLQRFTNDQGKILPKRITGVNATQQRAVTRAVKYARHLALLPFVADDAR